MLAVVAVWCFLSQFIVATWVLKDHPRFEAPNYSTTIAWGLLQHGQLAGGQVKLQGPGADPPAVLRRYQLPGETLYITAAYRLLPASLVLYAHLPITVLLVASVAWVASRIAGPPLGLATGVLASLQPFVVLHGPVWDDAFLAAALVWLIVAVLSSRLGSPNRSATYVLAMLFGAAAWAALARQEAQMILSLLASLAWILPACRPLRRESVAVAGGVLAALLAWGIRNRIVTGEFALGASRDGITLWEWNGPNARAVWDGNPEALSYDHEVMRSHWNRVAGRSENDINRYYLGQIREHVWQHPFDTLTTSLSKLSLSLAGVAVQKPLTGARNLVALGSNTLLILLALRGLSLLRRILHPAARLIARWFFPLIALPVLAALLVGPVGLRYRIALDGVLWIAAALAALDLLDRFGWTRSLPAR